VSAAANTVARKKPQREPEDELHDNNSSVVSSLCYLAKNIRECAKEIAGHVEGVAWAIDRERRGALSVGARQDGAELASTILDLLDGDLLDDDDRAEMRRRVATELGRDKIPVPAKVPPTEYDLYREFWQRTRHLSAEDKLAFGRSVAAATGASDDLGWAAPDEPRRRGRRPAKAPKRGSGRKAVRT
jgi:hypothetical protein